MREEREEEAREGEERRLLDFGTSLGDAGTDRDLVLSIYSRRVLYSSRLPLHPLYSYLMMGPEVEAFAPLPSQCRDPAAFIIVAAAAACGGFFFLSPSPDFVAAFFFAAPPLSDSAPPLAIPFWVTGYSVFGGAPRLRKANNTVCALPLPPTSLPHGTQYICDFPKSFPGQCYMQHHVPRGNSRLAYDGGYFIY